MSDRPQREPSSVTILTAGYGNRGFPAFVELLKSRGVTHLVDVRSVPQSSYWEDFRRARLERIVPETGLRYVYMGDTLGGVADSPALCKDPDAFADADLAPMRATALFAKGLDALLRAASDPAKTLCLMCGCKSPHRCHRSRLIAPALVARGATVLHILADDSVADQTAVEAQATGFQPGLF